MLYLKRFESGKMYREGFQISFFQASYMLYNAVNIVIIVMLSHSITCYGGIKIRNQNNEIKETYSINEIAKILDISNKTAYSLVHGNFFKHVRIGRIIRISKKSFDQWLNKFADA